MKEAEMAGLLCHRGQRAIIGPYLLIRFGTLLFPSNWCSGIRLRQDPVSPGQRGGQRTKVIISALHLTGGERRAG